MKKISVIWRHFTDNLTDHPENVAKCRKESQADSAVRRPPPTPPPEEDEDEDESGSRSSSESGGGLFSMISKKQGTKVSESSSAGSGSGS